VNERADAGDDEDHHDESGSRAKFEVELHRPDADHFPRVAVEVTSLVRQRRQLRTWKTERANATNHGAHRDQRDAEASDVELLRRLGAEPAGLEPPSEERVDDASQERQKRMSHNVVDSSTC